jgi:hypothetical protein
MARWPTTVGCTCPPTEENYRPQEDREHFGDRLSEFWPYIAGAKRIWIYGFSMDPADAELSMALRTGLSDPPRGVAAREIVISALGKHMGAVRRRVDILVATSKQPATVVEDPVGDPARIPPCRSVYAPRNAHPAPTSRAPRCTLQAAPLQVVGAGRRVER